jgi:hypothetical protein
VLNLKERYRKQTIRSQQSTKVCQKLRPAPKAFVECGGKGRPIGDGDGEKVPKNSNMSPREGIVPSRGLCILIIGASRGKRIQVRKKSVNPMR